MSEEEFNQYWKENETTLKRRAIRVTYDKDAEDFLGAAYLHMREKCGGYKKEDFCRMVPTIMFNLSKTRWREQRHEPITSVDASVGNAADGGMPLREMIPADYTGTPENALELAEADRLLEDCKAKLPNCIEKLTPIQRMDILLYYIDELSQEEVAKRRGVTATAVQNRLIAGIRNLRKCLELKGITADMLVPIIRHYGQKGGRNEYA